MRKKALRIRFILFFLLMLLFSLSLVVIKQKNSYDIRSRASVEDDTKYCVNAPECCARINETHDAHECDWPIRGYCRNCSSIEGKNERCGWYWIFHNANDNEYKLGTNSPDGYGCMIGNNEGSMRPKYNADGTINKPQPTAIPTTIPTQELTSITLTTAPESTKKIIQPTPTHTNPYTPFPTAVTQPKIINVFESPTPTSRPFKINFRIPAIQINLTSINKNVKKSLGFFEYIFRTIVSYDKKLEEAIDNKIGQIQFDITKIKL